MAAAVIHEGLHESPHESLTARQSSARRFALASLIIVTVTVAVPMPVRRIVEVVPRFPVRVMLLDPPQIVSVPPIAVVPVMMVVPIAV